MPDKRKVVRYSRDYRKPPRWGMGLPKRRAPRRRRMPLLAWMMIGVIVVVILPVVVDAGKGMVTPSEGCRIWQITDGDTVRVLCEMTPNTRARLQRYDSPELFSPQCGAEWLRAVAATYYLRWQFWKAGRVTVQLNGEDRYGRLLAVVLFDGQLVARRMVNAGMGRWYDGGQRAGWCT